MEGEKEVSETKTVTISALKDVQNTLDSMRDKFATALASHIEPDKFLQVVKTAIAKNETLLQCDRPSLWLACMEAASKGLLPDGIQGAIVPFKGQAKFMAMDTGLKDVVWKTGRISAWHREVVKAGDEFEFELGSDPFIKHKKKLGGRGEVIAAYSIVTMTDGTKSIKLIDIDDINKAKSRSKRPDQAWASDFDRMAEKTVSRLHYKDLPHESIYDAEFADDEDEDTPPPPTETKVSSIDKLREVVTSQTKTVSEDVI